MSRLTWERVRGWRVARHRLHRPAPRGRALDVASELCGVHAQVMSSAELALSARVSGLARAEVSEALWERRTLVKTWAMRGTLHLIASEELPLYCAALGTRRHFEKEYWLRAFGVTLAELEAFFDLLREVLSDEPMTREEIADEAGRRVGTGFREQLLSGWGTLLKPAAFQGILCFGPSRGRNVTFVRPDRWLPRWEDVDPEASLLEVARRFLATYGPTGREDLARWWGTDPPHARRVLAALEDEIEEVDVEGYRGYALRRDLPRMRRATPASGVRLLGMFDPYVVGFRPRDGFLDPAHTERVYRKAAWISAVLLVDGRAAGTWEHRVRGARIQITVSPFGSLTKAVRAGVEREAERVAAFLGGDLVLSI